MERHKITEIGDIKNYLITRQQIEKIGSLRMDEMRQLTENGIPIFNLIQEKLSLLEGSYAPLGFVRSRIRKGEISAELVNEILSDYFI